MKKDINLIFPSQINRTYIVLMVTLILFSIFVTMAFALPLRKRNRLLSQAGLIAKEVKQNNSLKDEYLKLKKHSSTLLKKREIEKQTQARQEDISEVLELIDDSISSDVQITNVSILENILTIQGTASNDRKIADTMLKLHRSPKIESLSIQEVSLDKDSLRRVFHIKSTVMLQEVEMNISHNEGGESVDTFN